MLCLPPLLLALAAYATAASNTSAPTNSTVDYSQYVNPFIGQSGPIPGLAFGGGDIFVGGSLPFGVAKVGIDTYEPNVSFSTINGGYTPEGLVTAVSMMHESGTGGSAKYGIISQMPLATLEGVNVLDNTTYWQKRVSNVASVGYYATKFENGVGIQLSAGRHSGIMEYSFPKQEAHVLVDVSHYLPAEGGSGDSQFFQTGQIEIADGGKTYTGYGAYGGGFSESAPMTTYFCAEFETAPSEAKTFKGKNTDSMGLYRYNSAGPGPVPQPVYGNMSETSGPLSERVGALFSWANSNSTTIRSRVGISMISSAQACRYKDQEIKTWNVNDTVKAAVQEWNTDVFSKIRVPTDSSQNRTNLVLLYSSMYFMHLMPSNRNGENPLWEGGDYWDDFYTVWDIFRCTVTMYQLIQPTYYASMIRGMIEIWKHEGFMPDGRSGDYNGIVQGGSNADNVLADAYVRGLKGVNWTEGYMAMVTDAEVIPYNTYSFVDPSNGIKEGRGALYDWKMLGYLAADIDTRSLSRSVEYALNDYSLSVLAKEFAPGDVQKYLNRSAQWQNNWDHNLTHKGFTGFLTPRLSTGPFNTTDYNPALCGGCEWTSISYEGTPFEYSFTVPHDMETLIEFMGGEEEFERRLDYIFVPGSSEQNLGANGAGITTLMNIGNEPDFATPYEYNYLNKQYKSVNMTRTLANQFYGDRDDGVPGNSDAGAENSWLLWQMLGMYPVVTQTVFLLGSPWFTDINMTINGDKNLRITATNLDNANSYFVQSVKINGQPWDKNWFEHGDVMVEGGTIEFVLGSNMTRWETGPVPPSPGHFKL